MSDDSKQENAELDLDSKPPEGDAGAASTTSNATEKVNGEGEESATLELKESDKGSKAEDKSPGAYNKHKQVETWADRYYNGEVEFEKIPKWIQQEIQNAERPNESVDDVLDRKIAERDSKKKFESLQQKLNKRGLTKSEASAITSEFTELRGFNVPPDVALEKAIKNVGIDLKIQSKEIDPEKAEKRKNMQIPSPGGTAKETTIDESKPYSEIQGALPKEARIKYLQKLRDRQLK